MRYDFKSSQIILQNRRYCPTQAPCVFDQSSSTVCLYKHNYLSDANSHYRQFISSANCECQALLSRTEQSHLKGEFGSKCVDIYAYTGLCAIKQVFCHKFGVTAALYVINHTNTSFTCLTLSK